MRWMLALALLAATSPATARDIWPDRIETKPLSARAKVLTGPDHFAQGDDVEYMAKELSECQPRPDKPLWCITATLALARPWEETGRAQLVAAGEAVERAVPVDIFPLLAMRQAPSGNRTAGLILLDQAASALGPEYRLACPGTRLNLQLAVAQWRMGGSGPAFNAKQAADGCGENSPEAAAAAMLYAVTTTSGVAPVQYAEDAARDGYRRGKAGLGADDARLGSLAANLGSILARRGKTAEAEALLREAMRIMEKAGDRERSTAVAVELAALLADLNRTGEARALALSPLLAEPWPDAEEFDIQRRTLRARLEPDSATARIGMAEAVATARKLIGAKPDPALLRLAEYNFSRLPKLARNMEMFQGGLELERTQDGQRRKRILGNALLAQAERAFVDKDWRTAVNAARESREIDGVGHRPYLIEGLAALFLGEGGNSEFLFGSASISQLPAEHPDRPLIALGFTLYYLWWNPLYAPCYSRRAIAAALDRLNADASYGSDTQAELQNFSGVFRLGVLANWGAAQRLEKSGETNVRCPYR